MVIMHLQLFIEFVDRDEEAKGQDSGPVLEKKGKLKNKNNNL